jgi:hypothetical protein
MHLNPLIQKLLGGTERKKLAYFTKTWHCRILYREVLNITSRFHTVATLKSFMKENNYLNKTCRRVHDLYCNKCNLSKRNGSWAVSITLNMNDNFQPLSTFVFFVFHRNGLIKSCSLSKDLSEYNTSWSHVDWYKFCIHLRSSSVFNFRTGASRLKCMALRSPSRELHPY